MDSFTHALCQQCWDHRHPGGSQPIVVLAKTEETCCDCGRQTTSGIYLRQHPKTMKCGGKHKEVKE